MKIIVYKGVELQNTGISWYAIVNERQRLVGQSLAEAKRWVNKNLVQP